MGVICDYLSVTYPFDQHPAQEARYFLLSLGAAVATDELYRLGDGGTVTIGVKYGTMRISASGAALAAMREAGSLLSFLSLLGSHPHRVTLLDAALDFEEDAAPVLKALQRRYKGRRVHLGRKGMEWTVLMAERPSDGAMTGTFYVGRKTSARVTAKVYDKQEEARARRAKITGPRIRYEVSVKKDYGATLRDAAEPDRLFWHVASPALLPKPGGIGEWSSEWAVGWSAGPRPDLLPAEVLSRRVERSPELDLLASLADDMGPEGRVLLLRRIADVMGVSIEGRLSRGSQRLSGAAAELVGH